MKISELKSTNDEHKQNCEEWAFFEASYEGAKKLVELGYIEQHERESQENYMKRMKESYGFSYSGSVIDILSYYLFKAFSVFSIGKLAEDTLWQMFVKDCDLEGSFLNDWFIDQQKEASKYGHVGILIDKPNIGAAVFTRQAEIEKEIYPYLSAYTPLSILDWEYSRDEFNRPHLSYLKLQEKDDHYRIWTRSKWELWKINDKPKAGEGRVILVSSGDNPLGAIPFVWLINIKRPRTIVGISDIKDVAYIDVSIMRNLSQGEEVIDYSAFPMMRRPKSTDDDVGVTAILEFDPETPESKPDWLEAKCKEPIDAIITWMKRKTDEIYRVVNVGGITSTETSKQSKSGVALKVEFQLLNSKLVKKGKNVALAKYQVIKYWLMWQNQKEFLNDISYITPTGYDVENLATDLQNALTAKSLIDSKTFSNEIQKAMARETLPGLKEDEYKKIDEEISSFNPLNTKEI